VLVDFGSTSFDGLNLLKAAGIQYIIIDHHPPGEGIEAINPFFFAKDASKYTAGYLACEIASACGEEMLEFAKIACSGDKSKLIPNDETDAKKAMVLDFLAAHISYGNNLDFYKKVMAKKELFDSIALQADESIVEAVSKVNVKKTKEGELEIITFGLDNVVKKGEWPPSGKITTRIFETTSTDVPLLCIGYNERTLILRINDAGVEKGLSANDIAKKINEKMGDFVESGGGHARAGAIRVRQGFVKDVLGEVLRMVK
jgi:RecJ-like exonuclease